MMLEREGGRRERETARYHIPYLTYLRLAIEKENQDLVYIVIPLFSSVHLKHLCHIVSDGTRLEEVVKKTV